MTQTDQSATTPDLTIDRAPTIRVFGSTGVEQDGVPIGIGGPRQRRLLALLAVRAGSTLSLDWLAEHLWTDEDRPDQPEPALWTSMSRLRRSFPKVAEDWLETDPTGYRLAAPADAIEHRRFRLLREEALRSRGSGDPATSQRLLDEALSLWRGEPFPELEDLNWAQADTEQLRIDRLEVMEERWEAILAQGRHTQITGELTAFTSEHGLRDRAARQLALALHRSGRTAEALRSIEEHRRTLAEESGMDPSADMAELELALLRNDPDLLIEETGRPLRGYRLLDELGSGAFSVVWRAVQPSVKREVAIKQIRPELASRPDFIRRFEVEAQLVARIEHPHIVPLIDFWRDPDSAYLVMRWLGGGTLEERLDAGPLTLEETLALATEIGSALTVAHERGVIHRDVKPANILFDDRSNSFLSDFGIALDVDDSAGPESAMSPGSPIYASPEQVSRHPLGPQADIFSLGVVLFECLTGTPPSPNNSTLAGLANIPANVVDAVAKAMADEPADRFESIDHFLEALSGEGTGGSVRRPAKLDPMLVNPYKGLRAFGGGDSGEFFGRERATQEMVSRLDGDAVTSRCLVVVGPSGSGKSSIVKAGLVPALRAGAVAGSEEWYETTMVPGTNPYEALETALLRIASNPPPSLLAQLEDGPRGMLRGAQRCLPSDEDRLLIVIDQFEELFIGESAEYAHDFLEALIVAVDAPDSPLRVVATLRADYYHHPLEHPGFAHILKDCSLDITPMTGDELEQAIVEPAARLGVGLEPGLVPRIVADTVGQPSPLPLLQYALHELFERRSDSGLTIAAYDDFGGVSGALATQAERLYTEAGDEERAAIRRVFGAMTNPGEASTDLRRRLPLADLGDDANAAEVLRQYGDARLVTFDRDASSREPTVEVAHEALLREWPRLVDWLTEDLDVLRRVNAIGLASTSWDDAGREEADLYRGGRLEAAVDLSIAAPDRLRGVDTEFISASRLAADSELQTEKARVVRLRRLVAGVGLGLVVSLIAGGLAIRQQQRADDEADRAQVAANEAEAQAALAQEQTVVAERQTVLAEQQTEVANEVAAELEIASMISQSAALSFEDPTVSVLLALEAHRRRPGPETEQAVLASLGSSGLPNRVANAQWTPDPSCDSGRIGADGTQLFSFAEGSLIEGTAGGEFTPIGEPPAPCVLWTRDATADRRWALDLNDRLTLWLGTYDGGWDTEVSFAHPAFVVDVAFTSAGHLVVLIEEPEGIQLRLLDTTTGDFVGPPVEAGPEFLFSGVSPDGSLVALSFSTPEADGGSGTTVVVDGETGAELLRLTTELPLVLMTFDSSTNEMLAAMFDGRLLTIDLTNGNIVSEVSGTTDSVLLDLHLRDDGLLTMVSKSQVEVFDRREGPVGSTTPLRGVQGAWMRSDGKLSTVTTDQRFEVFELDTNPLLEHSHDVLAIAPSAFNDGLAGAMQVSSEVIEIVDLLSGERRSPTLVMPDGQPLNMAKIYPETDGLWSASADSIVVRWVDEEPIFQLDLGGAFLTGTRYLDLWSVVSEQSDGRVVNLLDLGPDSAEIVFSVDAPDASSAHPSREGGMHIIDEDGRLHTYDSNGALVADIETGADSSDINNTILITLDPATGKIAIAGFVGGPAFQGRTGGVLIIDPITGDIEELPVRDEVVNLGFGREGELLAITASDGTVRLWDIERNTSAGVLWSGSGSTPGSPSWYDEETETIWVHSSGKVLQFSLNPERWLEQACAAAGRNFTQDEWDRYVPGDELLWHSCVG